MSMSLTDAKTYVSAIVGGVGTGSIQSQAADAIKAAAGIWSRHRWNYLRKSNANSPITVSVNVANYALPADFAHPYTARLVTLQQPLTYIKARYWDKAVGDQTVTGWPWLYTIDNPSGWTAGVPTYYFTLFQTPSTADTLILRYYRKIDGAADPVDVPDEYLYDFLDTARVLLWEAKAPSAPGLLPYKASVQARIIAARGTDMEESEDEFLSFRAPSRVGRLGFTSTSGSGADGSVSSDDEYFPGGMET